MFTAGYRTGSTGGVHSGQQMGLHMGAKQVGTEGAARRAANGVWIGG